MRQSKKERFKNADAHWIRTAIELAKKGESGASPNPLVGCVIVKNNRVVGTGSHLRFGGPHAEVSALRKSGGRSQNAVLYTNLIPCCHHGKTPPCTDAIIRSGIKKVVYSMPDPNPLVGNKSRTILQKSGIQVEYGPLKQESKELNKSFIKYMTRKKPYVVLKSAMSMDGKISTSTGDSKWITSERSRNYSYKLRTQMDAILVGAQTVRLDNPSLTSHGRGRNPVRVLLTKSAKIPKNSNIFDRQAPTWVFHSNASLLKKTEKNQSRTKWIYCKPNNGKINFNSVLNQLANLGISRLLVEGGGMVSALALESKEVDEALFFLAPMILGGLNAKSAVEGSGFKAIKTAPKLRDLDIEKIDPDILVRARVVYGDA